jgi:hypothetical protein
LPLWSVDAATVIRPTKAAHAADNNSPTHISALAPISVTAAAHAWMIPGRTPSDSNQLAVPWIPAAPNTLLAPWVISIRPSVRRMSRSPVLTESSPIVSWFRPNSVWGTISHYDNPCKQYSLMRDAIRWPSRTSTELRDRSENRQSTGVERPLYAKVWPTTSAAHRPGGFRTATRLQ